MVYRLLKLAGIPARMLLKKHKSGLRILEKQQQQQSPNQLSKMICLLHQMKPLNSEKFEQIIEIEKVVESRKVSSPMLYDLLKQIEVDNLSPRQALEQLYAAESGTQMHKQ